MRQDRTRDVDPYSNLMQIVELVVDDDGLREQGQRCIDQLLARAVAASAVLRQLDPAVPSTFPNSKPETCIPMT